MTTEKRPQNAFTAAELNLFGSFNEPMNLSEHGKNNNNNKMTKPITFNVGPYQLSTKSKKLNTIAALSVLLIGAVVAVVWFQTQNVPTYLPNRNDVKEAVDIAESRNGLPPSLLPEDMIMARHNNRWEPANSLTNIYQRIVTTEEENHVVVGTPFNVTIACNSIENTKMCFPYTTTSHNNNNFNDDDDAFMVEAQFYVRLYGPAILVPTKIEYHEASGGIPATTTPTTTPSAAHVVFTFDPIIDPGIYYLEMIRIFGQNGTMLPNVPSKVHVRKKEDTTTNGTITTITTNVTTNSPQQQLPICHYNNLYMNDIHDHQVGYWKVVSPTKQLEFVPSRGDCQWADTENIQKADAHAGHHLHYILVGSALTEQVRHIQEAHQEWEFAITHLAAHKDNNNYLTEAQVLLEDYRQACATSQMCFLLFTAEPPPPALTTTSNSTTTISSSSSPTDNTKIIMTDDQKERYQQELTDFCTYIDRFPFLVRLYQTTIPSVNQPYAHAWNALAIPIVTTTGRESAHAMDAYHVVQARRYDYRTTTITSSSATTTTTTSTSTEGQQQQQEEEEVVVAVVDMAEVLVQMVLTITMGYLEDKMCLTMNEKQRLDFFNKTSCD